MLFVDYLVRIGAAFLAGTLIGVERQCRQRNAGLRTNVLVSVGSAAFAILSCVMTADGGDPSRIAAQIVSGIGFLGGGLILKDGFNVRGLNTAATIWCSAACGTMSGVGLYAEAAVLAVCVLAIHCLFRPLCKFIERRADDMPQHRIRVECSRNALDSVRQTIVNTLSFGNGIKVNSLFYKEQENGIVVLCDVEMQWKNKALLDQLICRLKFLLGVDSVGWEQRDDMPVGNS